MKFIKSNLGISANGKLKPNIILFINKKCSDCQLIIELEESTAVISDRGSDLKAVINRAVHRAVQNIRRQLQHQQMS
ncbi:MAG TPA: hypothetical protein PL157_09240, partial [Acidobacteriota bacterium]|nr:hypothetical protein [Acidobacteriota bacterium]